MRKSASTQYTQTAPKPSVTILVAARNEKLNIRTCIDSLKSVLYEKELLEIILVNDNSDDDTLEIMKKETAGLNHFTILDTKDCPVSKLRGKTRALDFGFSNARGDLIMMTDADCTVSPGWINEAVKYYDYNTGMICGFTRIRHTHSLFTGLQSLDWIYLQAIAASGAGINSPLSCIGNNLSVSRKAYEAAGGYSNLEYSITEDLSLLNAVHEKNFSVKYPVNSAMTAETAACASVRELYRQKKRWFRGGAGINLLGYFLGILLYAMNALLVSGFLYLDIQYYLSVVFLKLVSELIIIIPLYKKLELKNLMVYFPFFQLYFAAYGLLLPFTFLTGKKVQWKGRNA
ncbi:MAG TPA: glycosyltransferase [Ignavibacteria bacterium]|nr:glycosyltransferase [Ignavibacteria bacterium]